MDGPPEAGGEVRDGRGAIGVGAVVGVDADGHVGQHGHRSDIIGVGVVGHGLGIGVGQEREIGVPDKEIPAARRIAHFGVDLGHAPRTSVGRVDVVGGVGRDLADVAGK